MQLRFLTCIPVYNHPGTVVDIINRTIEHSPFPILVVDDGSHYGVQKLFLEKSPHGHERVHFVRHEKNQGKGAALQTAFRWAVLHGYTHAISIDADGQHDPAEIALLVKTSEQNPWAFVIGDRQMKTQNVPSSSVFGKAFSNFWVKYQNEQFEGDSQSGFRIYPLFYLQTMKFLSKNYDFEIEVLTRLMWRGVEVKSTPITVKYFPGVLRVTHFNKFKDNLRLTLLNALLVTVSLLRREDSPLKSSVAVALGVFVGCYPVYGLHTAIVALLAFLFRMNFIYLWLGTQISLPPLIPFLVIGADFASQLYLSHPPHGIFGFSSDWLIGITILATVCALGVGIMVYIIKSSAQKVLQSKRSKVAVQSKEGLGIAFMRFTLKRFGLRPAYFILLFIVPYYYIFSARARSSANEYWRVIKPELNFFSRQKKVLRQLFVFAQVLVDRAFQKNADALEFEIVEGYGIPNFKEDLQNLKQGLVTMQCHLGGWEISMSYFRHRFVKLNKKMVAVMFGQGGAHDHSSMKQTGEHFEVAQFNQQQDTVIKLKSYLERGDIVGLMSDRPVGRSYELIPFCGKLGLFDSTGVRLANLCQANIYFIFSLRLGYKKYYVNNIRAPIDLEIYQKLNSEEKSIYVLKQYAQLLESYLIKNPEQWFNFFPFWSETLF